MTRTLRTTCLVTLLAIASGCAAQPAAPAGPTPEDMVKAADALDAAFVDAFNKGDAAAMTALYWNSPDVVSAAPDVLDPFRGIEAIREANVKMVAGMAGSRLALASARHTVVGDIVLSSGLFTLTMPGPTGPMEVNGRFTDVKAQRDGKWVYLMDHASVPLPPPPAPAPPASK